MASSQEKKSSSSGSLCPGGAQGWHNPIASGPCSWPASIPSGGAPWHPQPPFVKLWIQAYAPSCDSGLKDLLKSKTKQCSWKLIGSDFKYQTSTPKPEIYKLKLTEFMPTHTQYTPHPNAHTSKLTSRSDVPNLEPHRADPQKPHLQLQPYTHISTCKTIHAISHPSTADSEAQNLTFQSSQCAPHTWHFKAHNSQMKAQLWHIRISMSSFNLHISQVTFQFSTSRFQICDINLNPSCVL